MKKKTAYISMGLGGALMVACSPVIVSWACIGKWYSDPRAQYVSGIGHVAGFMGFYDYKQDCIAQAVRIEHDIIFVSIPTGSEQEMGALWEKAVVASTHSFTIQILDVRKDAPPGMITFELYRVDEEEFRRQVDTFRSTYKNAQSGR